MGGEIIVFGATGYTGDLTARALVSHGARPVLAGRDAARLAVLSAELGGLETRVADIVDPASVAALIEPGDVLLSTVGPFSRWGAVAVEAAISRGALYIDSNAESTFIRQVFEQWGPRAAAAETALVTAFGFDWVPGNLAGAMAISDAGSAVHRVEIAYFLTGSIRPDLSSGTRASLAGVLIDPSFAWRDRRIITQRTAARVRRFDVDGKRVAAFSVGTSEAYALPKLAPALTAVDVYLGAGPASRPVAALSALASWAPTRRVIHAVAKRAITGSGGGPDAATRSKSGALVFATAFNEHGDDLTQVRLQGGNVYAFTAEILAWGAMTALTHGVQGTGALGPVDAFGLPALKAGAEIAGMAPSSSNSRSG